MTNKYKQMKKHAKRGVDELRKKRGYSSNPGINWENVTYGTSNFPYFKDGSHRQADANGADVLPDSPDGVFQKCPEDDQLSRIKSEYNANNAQGIEELLKLLSSHMRNDRNQFNLIISLIERLYELLRDLIQACESDSREIEKISDKVDAFQDDISSISDITAHLDYLDKELHSIKTMLNSMAYFSKGPYEGDDTRKNARKWEKAKKRAIQKTRPGEEIFKVMR